MSDRVRGIARSSSAWMAAAIVLGACAGTPPADWQLNAKLALDRARSFRDEAPTTAAAAAKIILDGVKAERWRILVGDDAHKLDERVRKTPEKAYTPEFFRSFAEEVGWRLG